MNKLIREEIDNGVPSERIVVGGFSQGCALSLLTGLTSEAKLGGIIGCSGWLVLSKKIASVSPSSSNRILLFFDLIILDGYRSQQKHANFDVSW